MSKAKIQEKEIEENDLVSTLEEKVGHLKPYWTQIAFGACALIIAILLGVFLYQQNKANEASKWQLLSIAQDNYRRTLDNASLSEFADQYPDDQAGLWALLFAADAEMRSGLSDFSSDKESGFDKIKKAQKFYQSVVDSKSEKSTMLQRRSIFGLAYAFESSGEFAKAGELYRQLVDLGEETPFFSEAKRALERTSNPTYASLFQKFREHEDDTEDAPGEQLPDRPDISFPESETAETQPDMGGGEFGASTTDASGSDSEDSDAIIESGDSEDLEKEQTESEDTNNGEN